MDDKDHEAFIDVSGENIEPDTAEPPSKTPHPPQHPQQQGRTLHGGREGSGRVTFGGPLEREQASQLSQQMMRSVEHQLHSASEHVSHISWIETEGSKHIPNKNELAITRFELTLSNGKVYTLEGPIINMRIQN